MEKGIIEYENGDSYFGESENGVRNGEGVYTSCGVKLIGVWKDNHLNGKGKMACQNFEYDGEFVNSVRNGYGIETHTDGTIYKGYFKNGKKHGDMKIFLKNGAIVECEFSNGVGVGEGTMIMTDGEKVPVIFKDGKLYFK